MIKFKKIKLNYLEVLKINCKNFNNLKEKQ